MSVPGDVMIRNFFTGRFIVFISVFALLASFYGCASYKGITPSAKMNSAPASLGVFGAAANGDWPAQSWWRQYNDPQLNELVQEALSGSPTIKEAGVRIRQAQAVAGIADSVGQPNLSANASSIYQRFTEHGAVPPTFAGKKDTVNSLTLNLGYDIDLWGKNKAEYKAAIGEVRAAEAEKQAAGLELSYAVTATYIRYALNRKLIKISKELLNRQEKIYELHKIRFDAGLDPAESLKYAGSAIEFRKAAIKALEQQQKLLANRLGSLTGKGPARGDTLKEPSISFTVQMALPSVIPAELIGRRPDITAQKWRIESMRKKIKSAKVDFYPNINLTAFAGLSTIGLESLSRKGSTVYGLGPAVTLPIFNGGRLKQNLMLKDAAYDAAVEKYNSLIVRAVQEVADTVVSYRETKRQLRDRQAALKKLEEAEKLAELSYRNGLTGKMPVLLHGLDILAEKAHQLNLTAEQEVLTASLARALGGGYEPAPVNKETNTRK